MPMPMPKETGYSTAERFWRVVRERPEGEHQYVSLLGLKTFEAAELHTRLEDGLSFEALERLRRVLDLPLARISELLRIPPRTLARRRDAKRLDPEESDRLLRLSRLVGSALRLFEGDLDAARAWLSSPQVALTGETPLAFARTEVGAREVENLIGRLEHGLSL